MDHQRAYSPTLTGVLQPLPRRADDADSLPPGQPRRIQPRTANVAPGELGVMRRVVA